MMKRSPRVFNSRGSGFDVSVPMASALIDNLRKMLAAGRDSALLRFSLGAEHLKINDASGAVTHLREAVRLDPDYSAAWKLLGRALTECGRIEEARAAYRDGIGVAERKGDKQAAKEMAVFLRRLQKPPARQ